MKSISTLLACGIAAASLSFNQPAHAGAVGGPKGKFETVLAYRTDVYEIPFRGGLTASVFVSGDGDTDVDLYIYDEAGNLVASDADLSDDCICRWIPKWTGVFRIEVKNRGSVYNRYSIQTN